MYQNVLNCPVSIERVGGSSVGSESVRHTRLGICGSSSDSSATTPLALKEGEFWLISRGDDRILAVEFGSRHNADKYTTCSDRQALGSNDDSDDNDVKRRH